MGDINRVKCRLTQSRESFETFRQPGDAPLLVRPDHLPVLISEISERRQVQQLGHAYRLCPAEKSLYGLQCRARYRVARAS